MTQNTLERPLGREVYFDLLRPYFLEIDLETIKAAYAFSKYGHAKQIREGGGRYFDHPKSVSIIIFNEWRVLDSGIIAVALLHDVQEDSFILSETRMIVNFGEQLTFTVKLLTKDPNNKKIYYPRLKQSGDWRAVLVKIADRIHNMRTLGARPRHKQLEQVEETRGNFFELCDILEKIIPSKYDYVVSIARIELTNLCKHYE